MSRRGLLAAFAAAVVLAGVGARTWWVNANATPKPDVVTHGMGEWIPLVGAYVTSGSAERTDGYSVRIGSAEVVSYNEYVSRYANDGSPAIEGLDIPSILVPSFEMRNDGSDGYLQIASMYLVPRRKNEFFLSDYRLLVKTEEKMREGGNPGLSVNIRKGTEYEIHPGYVHQGGTTMHGSQEIQEAYLNPIEDEEFELILSNMPVRHIVRISLASI